PARIARRCLRVPVIAFPLLFVLQGARRPPEPPPAHAAIESVALYQATEVPLASVERPIVDQTVPVIVGKPGAVRVVVSGAMEEGEAGLEVAGSTDGMALAG